jgi:hypothetical protein
MTGAPRYLIQVIFYAVAPDSHYVTGQPGACESDMDSDRPG